MRKITFIPKAIFYCMWFGLLPWRFYEKTCHYEGMSYLEHFMLNVRRVMLLIKKQYTFGDIRFEIQVNRL